MWKIRLIFNGSQIHFLSSTEPKEIMSTTGWRAGLEYTPVRSEDSDILGVLDWARQDIFISWRGTSDEFSKVSRPKRTKSSQRGDLGLQERIIEALKLQGGKLSMNQLATALDAPRKEVSKNVSILVENGRAKKFGKGFNPLVSREP